MGFSSRQRYVLLFALAVSGSCAGLTPGSTGSAQDTTMPPGYDEFAETLARGVSAWCRSIDTVEGIATAYIYMSATEIEALAKDDACVERRE